MATKTLNDFYLINGSDNEINLEVKIGGAGQEGTTKIKVISGSFVKPAFHGNLSKTDIGSNEMLHKKKLEIRSTITDLSRETNYTSLDIILTGGLKKKVYSLNKEVDDEGKSADYVCLIQFFDPKR